MKSKAAYQNPTLVNPMHNQSNTTFIDAEFYAEKQSKTQVFDLYSKHHDEPDFDCEFLQDISQDFYQNNSIDSDSEEDFADDYNDNQWDADIYDPYLESTYY